MKYAILAGAAAITIVAGTPAGAAQNSDTRGIVQERDSSDEDPSRYGSTNDGSINDSPRAPKRSSRQQSASSRSSTGGTAIPEPSNLLMLGLGLTGLIAGRMFARRRKKT